jgi:hypothetical protein
MNTQGNPSTDTAEAGVQTAGIRRLLVRLAVLSAAVVVTGIALGQYDAAAQDDNYLAAVLEKDRIIRSAQSPKVILVGGSNLAFGIDSKMMEDSLGMPVVNMGLYAKLGLKYMLAQVRPYIAKGDLVVVVPEYDQFYGDFANGDHTLNTALLYAPNDRVGDFIRSYSVIDVVLRPRVENARRSFLHAVAAAVGKEDEFFPPDTNPVYNRRSFNEYGDVVSHLGKPGMNPDSIYVGPLPPLATFNAETIDLLNAIADEARQRGATAVFMYPSYIDRSLEVNSAAIDSLRRKVEPRLAMRVVGTPADFAYPGELFFDTRFHLNETGRRVRTLRMIELLERR